MRLLVPVPTYGHLMSLIRRHVIGPATSNTGKFLFPVNVTCREFLNNRDSMDAMWCGGGSEEECPLVPPPVKLSEDKLYFETAVNAETFDFALTAETCDMMSQKDLDFSETRVERFVGAAVPGAQDWTVVLLLWWSLFSLRLNEKKAHYFAKQITRGVKFFTPFFKYLLIKMLGQLPELCPAMLYFFFVCTTFEWCTGALESRGRREKERDREGD